MHRVSEISTVRTGRHASRITITLRSPELAKALHGTGAIAAIAAWGAFTVVLGWFAWNEGLGSTAHASVRFCIIAAFAYWTAVNANRLWQDRNRTTLYHLIARLDDRRVAIDGPDGGYTITRGDNEIRFSSQPHRRGKYEEREERRVERLIGYEYRDAWEVWCETGRDVRFMVAVSEERDARAIVRQLTEENLFVTRGLEEDGFGHERVEPA